MLHNCPLCDSKKTQPYYTDETRQYNTCLDCGFVFVPSVSHLNEDEEKSRYDQHQNNPEDHHYRQFLSQLTLPLLERISPGDKGLDFGCGPGPTLSVMLEEKGFKVDLFDKYYAKDNSIFDLKYDFISATEVLEHLSQPGFELNRLYECLNPGGVFGIMTEMLPDNMSFSKWYYKKDPTHIGFFSQKTFQYLANLWQIRLTFISDRVVIFEK